MKPALGVTIDAHGVAWRGGKRLWTAAEDDVLRARYPHELTDGIAEALGRPVGATFQRALSLGLRKSADYLASPEARRLRHGDTRGAATRFKPGNVPANKGVKRGRGWAPGRMAVGQFKPGNALNWMPVGSRRDISGYVYIKMADVRHVTWCHNWFPEHILVWEMANGRQLPAGHAVAFRNGDRRDMRPENLELVTRRELMRRNSMHTNLPKPIVQTIQLLGALKRQIRRRDRHAV